jgi:hypothetical protein
MKCGGVWLFLSFLHSRFDDENFSNSIARTAVRFGLFDQAEAGVPNNNRVLSDVKQESGALKGIFVSIVRNTKAKSRLSKS